jgi:zinc transport system ATP-binding protein
MAAGDQKYYRPPEKLFPAMSEPLLSVEKVTLSLDGQKVLEDVDLQIMENDFIGVIGPNGGGKTSLVKVILGLLKPDSGHVRYRKETLGGRHRIGYLPQVHAFDKKFPITVREVVLSGLPAWRKMVSRHGSADKDKAAYWMEKLGITALSGKTIGTLSGGEMQRTFLCRSLISEPRLLILDEPDTYVDNRFEQELYEILRELNGQMAILLVSHDVGTITAYIKCIACVNRKLHYHPSNIISQKQLAAYDCPIQIITHGDVPHTVLGKHTHEH